MSRLPADSYTARRLEHATPEHLHHTSKRTFVGPIPEGWLKSHRKQWYRQYLPIGKNDSRQNTFIAAQPAPAPERPTQNGASVVPPPQARQETTPQANGASVAPSSLCFLQTIMNSRHLSNDLVSTPWLTLSSNCSGSCCCVISIRTSILSVLITSPSLILLLRKSPLAASFCALARS